MIYPRAGGLPRGGSHNGRLMVKHGSSRLPFTVHFARLSDRSHVKDDVFSLGRDDGGL